MKEIISTFYTQVTYKSTPKKASKEKPIIFTGYLETDSKKKIGYEEARPHLRAQRIVLQ